LNHKIGDIFSVTVDEDFNFNALRVPGHRPVVSLILGEKARASP